MGEQSPPKSVSNFVDQAPCVEVQETASVSSESLQIIDQQETPAEELSGSETAITTSAPLAPPKLDDSVEQLEVTTTSTSKKEGEVELESTRQAQFEQSMEKALGRLGTLVKRLDDMDFAQNVGLSHRDNLPEVIKAIDVSVSSTLDGIAKTFFDRLEMKDTGPFASRWIRPASQIGDFDSLFERGFNAESAHFNAMSFRFEVAFLTDDSNTYHATLIGRAVPK